MYQGAAVVYNGDIHILGSGASGNYREHYKWNGQSWTDVSRVPYVFYQGSAVVYNGDIHLLGDGNSSYKNIHYSLLPNMTILDAPVLNEIEFKE